MPEYGKQGREQERKPVPGFRAFVAERDDRFDGPDGRHPGVFLGLGDLNEEPSVAFTGCGLCLATAVLESLYDSPLEAAEAVARAWGT